MNYIHKIWLQSKYGETILSTTTPPDISYYLLSEGAKKGIYKAFQIMTSDDVNSSRRIQIQRCIGECTSLEISMNDLPLFQSLYSGVFIRSTTVKPLYSNLPAEYRNNPSYTYYVLLKPFDDRNDNFIMAVQDVQELYGIILVLDYFAAYNKSFDVLYIEDDNGNTVDTAQLIDDGLKSLVLWSNTTDLVPPR